MTTTTTSQDERRDRNRDGPATLRPYVQEAGFKGIEPLMLEAAFFRFYRLISERLRPPAAVPA